VTDVTLASLREDELLPWLAEHPQASAHMLRALAQRLRRANDVIADLVFTDVPGRVAKNLLDFITAGKCRLRDACQHGDT
jgi:CRP/FNR family transcriptional regulator